VRIAEHRICAVSDDYARAARYVALSYLIATACKLGLNATPMYLLLDWIGNAEIKEILGSGGKFLRLWRRGNDDFLA
jgi:hypothetical protein